MDSQNTDPDLSWLLLPLLDAWHNDSPLPDTPFGLSHLLERHLGIGCQYMLEGWLSWEWETTRQAYYLFNQSRRSGKRWTIQLLKKLWGIAWDLWEHRNGILHRKDNLFVSANALWITNLRLSSQYGQLQVVANDRDWYLLHWSLSELLSTNMTYKRSWLTQAMADIASICQQERSHREAQQCQLLRMQQNMRQWLVHSR
jgi:hypothetical protein